MIPWWLGSCYPIMSFMLFSRASAEAALAKQTEWSRIINVSFPLVTTRKCSMSNAKMAGRENMLLNGTWALYAAQQQSFCVARDARANHMIENHKFPHKKFNGLCAM